MDTLFLKCCLNIGAHLENLGKSFDDDKLEFIRKHQNLLKLIKEMVQIFKLTLIVHFLVCSIQLCMLGFQVAATGSIFSPVSFFGLTIIFELTIYCHSGQLIIDKTSAVADNIYDLDKDVILIIARAKNGITVQAGFFNVTYETLSAILRSAGSMITLLKSFL